MIQPPYNSSTPPKTVRLPRYALLLLACADNLPGGDLLSRTLSGLEILLADAAFLYEGALNGTSSVHL